MFTMYCEERNKVYLIYLKSIIAHLQSPLKAFEAQTNDAAKLLETLVKVL